MQTDEACDTMTIDRLKVAAQGDPKRQSGERLTMKSVLAGVLGKGYCMQTMLVCTLLTAPWSIELFQKDH